MNSVWPRIPGSVRSVCACAVLLLAVGCVDDPLRSLLVEPAKIHRAEMALSYSLTPSAAARVAAVQVEQARVRLSVAGAVALDTVIPLSGTQQETRVALVVPMEQERQTFDLLVELIGGGTVVARAEETVTLGRGETNVAEVVANAVFAGVAAGWQHSCHLSADGRAFCWGGNFDGQLGDGTTLPRTTPVGVAGGLVFSQIAAAGANTCGLAVDGRAYCWGDNNSGGVGDGTQTDRSTPTLVAGGLQFASLAVGATHKCGVTAAGAAYCWGTNSQGQLGAPSSETCGSSPCSTTPVAVSGGHTFRQLVTGFFQTCGLTPAGTVYCWGNNQFGQLGTGTAGPAVATPTQISGGIEFVRLVGGSVHMCGLTAEGAAYCWGANFGGQIGDGTTVHRAVPTPVAGGLRFRFLASHSENSILGTTCGTTTDGVTYCWGANSAGQLGAVTSGTCGTYGSCSTVPVPVSGGLRFQSIDLGSQHTCGVTTQGRTYCWGDKGLGQLGDGSMAVSPTPSVVAGGRTYQSIDAGWGSHSCALTPAGEALCWGYNARGALGDGTTTSSIVPVAVRGGPFTRISTGASFSCALDASSQAFCWGNNQFGQVGDGTTTDRTVPTAVAGGLQFAALDIMTSYVSAIGADEQRTVYFWGEGGEGDSKVNATPTRTGTTGMQQTAAGTAHTCFLDATGAAFCRGQNFRGALGDGTTMFRATPVAVLGGLEFHSLTAGGTHTCGVTRESVPYCWGNNSLGHLGNGTTQSSSVPVAVAGNLSFRLLSAGNGFTCGVTTGGDAYCWGANGSGELGNGTLENRLEPTLVAGGRKWVTIDAGAGFTCGVTTSGEGLCWGNNRGGQLGNGAPSYVSSPVAVGGGAAASRGASLTNLLRAPISGARLVPPSGTSGIVPESPEIRTPRTQ